ncbi:hypothetical protein M413DRAFT_30248 [Hebeloma cylindrosporum]|uniref:DUF6534 domain-containing protein n=1 Tax=Hebeloma cylindrosporum TaxID=76867 RepID=A0A0C3C498_HEBCY|nr:hypothetical protein M413DRAFT_30248 [Hebeloma cylindrosporum h7]
MVQAQLYYRNFSTDWIVQRISVCDIAGFDLNKTDVCILLHAQVAILLTLVTFNLLFTLRSGYFYLIVNFGNPKGLESVAWSFKLQLLINMLTVILVQGLYTLRIWKLGRHVSRIWPAVVVFIAACEWVFGFFVVMKSFRQNNFTDFDSMRQFIYATFAILAGVDVIIATAFCYVLNWSRSSFVGTNNKISTVMRYVVIAGFLTSACSLSTLIAYTAMPDNMVFMAINWLLPNLYINSYIAMLNARKCMNEQETLSVDGGVLSRRPALSIRTDDGNLHSGDDKAGPSVPLSPTRFTPSLSNKYDLEQDVIQTLPWRDQHAQTSTWCDQRVQSPIPSPNRVGNTEGEREIPRIHRIGKRQSRVVPLWVSRRIQMYHASQNGEPALPPGAYNPRAYAMQDRV